ncbi:sensor histidine kinase [Nocardioides acrostichi]|uniref:histidine kinase n=1 Tax=Nocardioides acrostichi TaxID=2784339 RepID=A0A930UXD2_9ACTN|nr:HAMP domain-containing sensor histidine kinase [Nocardioides acrostichi]MBF4160124.1 HAMP domain-containing histidine kinase [Nocardioides acrostichi]
MSARAVELAVRILDAPLTISEACDLVAEHFLAGGVDLVGAVLTYGRPPFAGWHSLGGRAILGQWVRPGATCTVLPKGSDSASSALTMPWVSVQARDGSPVVISDVEDLPPEADQDRREQRACGVGSFVTRSLQIGGVMFGSFSLGRETSGEWPTIQLRDYLLLTSSLSSRFEADRQSMLLTDALAVGDRARRDSQEFFGAMGHELRTPLSAIMGYAEVLAEEARLGTENLAEIVAKDAPVILRAAEQLHAVVEDLLRTGRGLGRTATTVPVSVADAAADVLHWHAATAEKHGVTMHSEVPPGERVQARAAGLRQVLTNLVGNAVVHNRPGGTVHVYTRPFIGESGEPRLRIIVRDDGPGLEADDQARVFEPFVRLDPDSTSGTGLGLALARTIAEADGGSVGVQSVPGRGASFWVELRAVDDC